MTNATFRAILASAVIFLSGAFAQPVHAKSNCGGEGQAPCAYAKAISKGKLKLDCGKGAFLDPRKGGECWTCPNGYKRTAAAVTAGNACQRPVYTSYRKSKRHGAGKGIFKTDCSRGQFYDIGKKRCYSCPKHYKRTTSSVTSSRACSRRIGAKNGKAKYVSKGLCRSGSFFDATGGGTCWACPKGFGRSLASVKAFNACSKPLAKQAIAALKGETVLCSKGLIEIGGKCVKTGKCGKSGQRPCLIVERIPSCNKGYAENFLTNKCEKPAGFGKVCTETLTALQKKRTIPIIERLNAEKDRFIKLVSDKSGASKIIDDANREIAKVIKRPDVKPLHEELARLTNFVQEKSLLIKKELTAPKPFCTDTASQRLAKIKKLGLIPKFQKLKKAGLFDGFLIRTAHAAASKDFYYWSLSVSYSSTVKLKKVSIAVEVIFETNLKKDLTKVVAINHTTSANLAATEDRAEVDVSYEFYIDKTAADFRTFSPGIEIGASISLRNVLRAIYKVKKSETLRLLLEKDGGVTDTMDRFSGVFTFNLLNIFSGQSVFKNLDKVGVSVNLLTTPKSSRAAFAPLPTVSFGLGNTYPIR